MAHQPTVQVKTGAGFGMQDHGVLPFCGSRMLSAVTLNRAALKKFQCSGSQSLETDIVIIQLPENMRIKGERNS